MWNRILDPARLSALRRALAALPLALLWLAGAAAFAAPPPDAARWTMWHQQMYSEPALVLHDAATLDTTGWPEAERVRLALLRVRALSELGRSDESGPTLEQLREPVRRLSRADLQAAWETLSGDLRAANADLAAARRHWDAALPLAQQAGDAELESLIQSLRARAAIDHHDIGAAAVAIEADRQVSERSGDAQLIARHTYWAAMLQVVLDDPLRAEALFDEAARRFATLANRSWESDSLRHLAQVRLDADRPADALPPARRAVELLESLDDPVFLALARGVFARALASEGQYAEAVEQSRRALAVSTTMGTRDTRATALLQHARVLLRTGQVSAASHLLDTELQAYHGQLGAGWEHAYQRVRAETLSAQGYATEAAKAWVEVLRLDRQRAARVLDNRLQAQGAVMRVQQLQRENELLQERSHAAERALVAESRMRWTGSSVVALLALGVVGWIAWLRRVNRRIAHAAAHDSLTGLLNRRALLERATTLADSRRRRERPLGLVLVDVDHFKRVNDLHGHAAGDEVLRAVAASLREGLRDDDLIARWGGEEFLLLLPATTLEQAQAIAERQRRAVAALAVTLAPDAAPLQVTASFGVSAVDDGDAGFDRALERADQALYRAKAEGRDGVQVAPPPTRPSPLTLIA